MKFGSNLGLVRTLKQGKFKENRSLSFRDIEVRNRPTPYPIWAVWAIFKLAVRIAQSFETNEIWVKLRTGQDLKQGKFKENRSLSFRDIEVRNSRPHTQYGQYGPFSG